GGELRGVVEPVVGEGEFGEAEEDVEGVYVAGVALGAHAVDGAGGGGVVVGENGEEGERGGVLLRGELFEHRGGAGIIFGCGQKVVERDGERGFAWADEKSGVSHFDLREGRNDRFECVLVDLGG